MPHHAQQSACRIPRNRREAAEPRRQTAAGEGIELSNNEMTKARHSALPPTLAPRGLRRTEAAAYIGMSPSLFDRMVAAGRLSAVQGRIELMLRLMPGAER
jgi:hypothetical protein